MCGFVASIACQSSPALTLESLKVMTDTLYHRGPDDEGYFISPDSKAALGHRRLSIIDLDNGHQPLLSQDSQVALVFNGEIYNHKALRAELEQHGYQFQSRCDTEVVLVSWLHWGEQCLAKFNGMFAFVILDLNQNRAFIARDRLGIKPLFWHYQQGKLQFASELKALTKNHNGKLQLNSSAVKDYFSLGYVPEPNTIYQGFHKLEAGHCISVDLQNINEPKPVCYWDCLDSINGNSEFNLEDAQALLIDSINKRMIADVEVGAFLSGGLDSSIISSVMRQTAKVNTYSMGFDVKTYDETHCAKQAANLLATEHQDITVSYNTFEYLQDLVDMFDEPFADNSTIPTFMISKLAAQKVKVVLSGDGADELFLGYRNYRLLNLENNLKRLIPTPIRTTMFKFLAKHYPALPWAPQYLRAKSTFKALSNDSISNFHQAMSINSEDILQQLFSEQYKAQNKQCSSQARFHQLAAKVNSEDPIKRAQYIDFKTYLPSNILTKVDRTSMANSIEVRVPFLDHRLVESLVGLPSGMNIKGNSPKRVLRQMVADVLPESLMKKKKRSFTSPMDEWFRMATLADVKKLFNFERLQQSGLFNMSYLESLIHQHQSGKQNSGMTLWSIAVFSAFLHKMECINNEDPVSP